MQLNQKIIGDLQDLLEHDNQKPEKHSETYSKIHYSHLVIIFHLMKSVNLLISG